MPQELRILFPAEADKNLVVETNFPEFSEAVFRSVREEPFDLYGFCSPYTDPLFRRLPEDIAATGTAKLPRLARESAGGRVRFTTDSNYILIDARMPLVGRNAHCSLVSTSGFDLYEDTDEGSRYVRAFIPPYSINDGFKQIVRLPDRKERSFTIHFPIHSEVSDLFIGLAPDATLSHGRQYLPGKPIVIYGSSIVHGTAASRPGRAYPNVLCRRLNRNVIDMGFSGGAHADPEVMRYLAGLEMSVFVYDYDHNAHSAEELASSHKPGFDIIRAAQPDLPIIMISSPNVATNPRPGCVEVIRDTYRQAVDAGDKNVWFIDGSTFFRGPHEYDCTVDGVHPADLGFTLMCDGIEPVIRRALNEKTD